MNVIITPAEKEDLSTILALQKICYRFEAELYNNYEIPPLLQDEASIGVDFLNQHFLKAVAGTELVGSVRAYRSGNTCHIGRLIVKEAFQNKGIGRLLMHSIEDYFSDCQRYELFTGYKSNKNLHLYTQLGYTAYKSITQGEVVLIYLEKQNK